MKELVERLTGPTPTFWLRVRAFFVVVAMVGVALTSQKEYVPTLLHEPAKYAVAIGIAVGIVASFAKKDASDIVKIDIPKAIAAQVKVSLETPANVDSTEISVEHHDQSGGTTTTISPDSEAAEA